MAIVRKNFLDSYRKAVSLKEDPVYKNKVKQLTDSGLTFLEIPDQLQCFMIILDSGKSCDIKIYTEDEDPFNGQGIKVLNGPIDTPLLDDFIDKAKAHKPPLSTANLDDVENWIKDLKFVSYDVHDDAIVIRSKSGSKRFHVEKKIQEGRRFTVRFFNDKTGHLGNTPYTYGEEKFLNLLKSVQ